MRVRGPVDSIFANLKPSSGKKNSERTSLELRVLAADRPKLKEREVTGTAGARGTSVRAQPSAGLDRTGVSSLRLDLPPPLLCTRLPHCVAARGSPPPALTSTFRMDDSGNQTSEFNDSYSMTYR